MKIKRILSMTLVCSILFCMPVMAEEEIDTNSNYDIESIGLEYMESIKLETKELVKIDSEQADALFEEEGVQVYSTTPDICEPNNTMSTAYPYEQVPMVYSQLTSKNELFGLGMRHAGLHSSDDVDWYYLNMTGGVTQFIDLRNVGYTNWYIEIYYRVSNGTMYTATTNPEKEPQFAKRSEKYFYFEAPDDGTCYIRIANGGDWVDDMHYFFYAGPAIQTFNINNMLTSGGVQIAGSGYRTYTCDLTGVAVPATTYILNLSLTDSFPQGTVCSEVDRYMSAGGKTYYNTSGSGSSTINNIASASLGQLWTIGAKCAKGTHYTYWSGKLNGSFLCIMEPYPGNKI